MCSGCGHFLVWGTGVLLALASFLIALEVEFLTKQAMRQLMPFIPPEFLLTL
jgi:hypothetical protein